MLALYLAIRHFRFLVEGRNFTAFTDHKPLVDAIFKVSDPWTARQQRQLSCISSFTTDIEHIYGKDNAVAISNVSMGIDYTAMAAAQVVSEEIQAYRTAITNLQLADMPVCQLVLHSLVYPGRKAIQKLISDKFVWHNLNKDVTQWTKQCLSCQSSKIQKHVHAPLDTFVVPDKRFSHINIDIVGPLHPSTRFTYLLTIVDRIIRWSETIPLSDITAITCAVLEFH